LLYRHADPEEWFLLDFFLGTMARDAEADPHFIRQAAQER
jgi:hypothetical protein